MVKVRNARQFREGCDRSTHRSNHGSYVSLLLGAQLEDRACSGPAYLFGLVLRAHSQSSFAQP